MPHPAPHSESFHLALPAMGWLLGLCLLQQSARLPSAGEYAALLLAMVFAAGLALRSVRVVGGESIAGLSTVTWASLCVTLAAALLAFAQAAWRAELRLGELLPEAWEGRDVLVQGRVSNLPSATQGMFGAPGWRFAFEPEQAFAGASVKDPPLTLPPRLALAWYAASEDAAPPALRAGERWQLLLRLKRPHGLMNPHAFDFEFWMFEQDLRASGVVRPGGGLRLAAAPWWSLDALRSDLREALQRRVHEPAHAGILAALSLGDQAAISKRDWALFRLTGVSHLLSVSGLHVTMFAWGMQGLLGWLWRRSAGLCLRWPAPNVARWGGVAAALAYALFSGWGVPAQRTVWMLITLALLRSLSLRWPWPLCLLISAWVVTLIDPWAVGQAGFWLSFVAVGLLMAGGAEQAPVQGWRAHLRAGLRNQWVATCGLAPLSLLFFQQISLVGLLANVLAIPLVSFVITPLALLGALLPVAWRLAEWAVQLLMAYLHGLASWPFAVWMLPVAPAWAQALGLLGGVLLVLPLPLRLRAMGLAMLAPMLWPAPARPPVGEFELLAADIGQGTAVLLLTAEHQLLYDSGPAYGPDADAGQRVLLPLLLASGVSRLDLLMLSHRDSDHTGGAGSLLAGMPVAALSSSLEAAHPLLAGSVAARRCAAGQSWVWDGVRFEVLHPVDADYQLTLKSNAMSCVLRVTSASGHSALLTGDLEAPQELALMLRTPAGGLRSEVLLVPHHGSKTSSTEAFLDAVAPRWALVQAGYRNRFGHPAPAVLARYQARDIEIVSSAACGAWRWRSGPDGVKGGQCQREQFRRYWHWQPEAQAQLQGPWPRLLEPPVDSSHESPLEPMGAPTELPDSAGLPQ
ncbi:DNA internalization-related competence protein ComEC/Rec2 [Paucibacter sp. TC2R-5]|uniref:DNA internalization-related competence protein ComEC/Rec2 n=1 Tax=Paucibacter sp. TC2R-5 TaxID=2893555 RepID=UPI0021E42AB7|nr:DNA internalization-related competence protein ComEC/Rec2 [Paucibacter sp. TC2R-5]MCV2358956.1 DNA internalization-related competence protein ComEC/Rec2 [Paucibacter sp. TC2R-5]